MNNIEKIADKVEKRKRQLQPLFTKDDENYNLWAAKEQIFDTHKMSINITGTELIEKASRVHSSLVRSRLDIHVFPPDKLANPDAVNTANQEERMHYFGFDKADERLSLIGEATLLPSAAWQATVLGRIAVRSLVYKDPDTKEIIWDYLPMYPRFVTFGFDSKGLVWYCYETFRSAESIWDEYKIEVTEKSEGTGVSVSDYWDREHNVRYITEEKRRLGKTWKHGFGYVPAIILPVSRGPRALNADGIDVTTWGESLFDPIKLSFKNLNKMRSIQATHAHMIAKSPLEITYEGDEPNLEAEHFDYYPGAILKHPNTMKMESMKVADIPQSLVGVMADLRAGIDRATYYELNPDKPAHSGSALRILGQDKMDVETPRVHALNTMYTMMCRMNKKQIVDQRLTIPVKTVVNKEYQVFDIKPDLLDNDFYVNAELIRQDVYDEVEALQRGQMMLQLGLASRAQVMEEILKIQDVPTRIAEITLEKIKDEVPEARLKDTIKLLIESENFEDARLLMEQLAMLEIQKQQTLMGGMGAGAPQGMPQGGAPPSPPAGGA